MRNWYDETRPGQTSVGEASGNDGGAEPEYLYRDDLAYGQLAIEIANGELEADQEADLPPLDGWLADV
jgi:hypothetical protein